MCVRERERVCVLLSSDLLLPCEGVLMVVCLSLVQECCVCEFLCLHLFESRARLRIHFLPLKCVCVCLVCLLGECECECVHSCVCVFVL